MAAKAADAINLSIEALTGKNEDLAKTVIAGDTAVDELEKTIEHKALQIIIKYQPVAMDLRFVTSALKMITDIERIADQAADISFITLKLVSEEYLKELKHIPAMAEHISVMVQNSVKSFVNQDIDLARDIIKSDDVADAYFIEIKEELVEHLKSRPEYAEQVIYFMMIAKYLERIGDHAVNIAEWVIFNLTGVHKNSKIL